MQAKQGSCRKQYPNKTTKTKPAIATETDDDCEFFCEYDGATESGKPAFVNYIDKNQAPTRKQTKKMYLFRSKGVGAASCQSITFANKKISRKLLRNIEKSNISTLHGCGIYAYCALLCAAHTCHKHETGYSWVSGTVTEIGRQIGCKTKQETVAMLKKLQTMKYIQTHYFDNDASVIIYLLHTASTKAGRTQIRAEYAALYHATGFVYVNGMDMAPLQKAATSYSEADILLDMWLHIVYQDDKIALSGRAPLVCFRDKETEYTEQGRINVRSLAVRWNCSVGRIHHVLKRFESNGFISAYVVLKHGTFIYIPQFAEQVSRQKAKPVRTTELYHFCMPYNKKRVYREFLQEKIRRLAFSPKRILHLLNRAKQSTINHSFLAERELPVFFRLIENLCSLFGVTQKKETAILSPA